MQVYSIHQKGIHDDLQRFNSDLHHCFCYIYIIVISETVSQHYVYILTTTNFLSTSPFRAFNQWLQSLLSSIILYLFSICTHETACIFEKHQRQIIFRENCIVYCTCGTS